MVIHVDLKAKRAIFLLLGVFIYIIVIELKSKYI